MTSPLTSRAARVALPAVLLPALLGTAFGTAFGTARSAAQAVTPERRVGVIVHLPDARHVALLRAAHVRHVKTTLYWALWEADAAYRTEFAAGIGRLAAAGLELTVVVHAPPPGSSFAIRDTVYRRFAAFVGERAAQFPAVRNWQLWNEPDAGYTDVFGHGAVPPDAQGQHYAAMLTLAYPRIKRGNPGARVVVAGLGAPVGTLAAWLRGLYARATGAP
jgi:hypothetical protein